MCQLCGPGNGDPNHREQTCRWFSKDDLDSYKVFALKDLCKFRQLDKSGTKEELMKRLMRWKSKQKSTKTKTTKTKTTKTKTTKTSPKQPRKHYKTMSSDNLLGESRTGDTSIFYKTSIVTPVVTRVVVPVPTATWVPSADEIINVAKLIAGAPIIGKGGGGVVYSCMYPDASLRKLVPVAVKVLLDAAGSIEKKLALVNEGHFLTRLRHANVVQLFGFSQNPPAIVMELGQYGSLRDLINVAHGHPTIGIHFSIAVNLCHQMASGLHYLHTMNVIHRDLKPQNVVVMHGLIVKICDFGLSRVWHETVITSPFGTIEFMAPECFDGKFSDKSDVHAFGITCWELLTLKKHLKGLHSVSIMKKVVIHGVRPNVMEINHAKDEEVELRILLKKCWSPEKEDRPKMIQVEQELVKLKNMCPIILAQKGQLEDLIATERAK
jgi:hypothetical protein